MNGLASNVILEYYILIETLVVLVTRGLTIRGSRYTMPEDTFTQKRTLTA